MESAEGNTDLPSPEEAFNRLKQMESRMCCLERSVNTAVGTMMPKVDALLSVVRNRCSSRSKAGSSSTNAGPAASLLALAEQGDAEAMLRILAEEQSGNQSIRKRTIEGDTPLHVAASRGHLKAVIVLLGSGAKVDVRGHKIRTPLHCAAAHGHLQIVQHLLDAGAQVDAKDASGATTLELAIQTGSVDVVALLMERGALLEEKALFMAVSQGRCLLVDFFLQRGLSINATDKKGHTLLVQAAKADHWEMVQLLLNKGASAIKCKTPEECALALAAADGQVEVVRQLLRRGTVRATRMVAALGQTKSAAVVTAFAELVPDGIRGRAGRRSLLSAAKDGRREVLVALLNAGVHVEERDATGQTPLYLAALNGHLECVRDLLKRKANINARDCHYSTPLHGSCLMGHMECVLLLLDHGARINETDECTQTPLFWAAGQGHTEIIQLLLQHGADVNAKNKYGDTPLSGACTYGDVECVRELLLRGAEILKNDEGGTALNDAARQGHVECLQELLQRGAEISKDKNGNTALHDAARDGHVECVWELLQRGAETSGNNKGVTALHVAACYGYIECVRELLRSGAVISKDKDGDTALHQAARNGHVECVRALLTAGACPTAVNKRRKTPAQVAGSGAVRELLKRKTVQSTFHCGNVQE